MKRNAYVMLTMLVSLSTATPRDIPLTEVLSKPDHFNGKRVAVTGYYVAGTEESCLFTTREAARRFDIGRSVWVEFHSPPVVDSISHRRARVVGTFHYNPTIRARVFRTYGLNSLWSVALLDVTDFRPLK